MQRGMAQGVARSGKEIYERENRGEVEPEHEGCFLVVDVNSGCYALAGDELEAFDRARGKTPEGLLYLVRAGRRAAHSVRMIAAGPSTSRAILLPGEGSAPFCEVLHDQVSVDQHEEDGDKREGWQRAFEQQACGHGEERGKADAA